MHGPEVKACDDLHAQKYRLPNESFEEAMHRVAGALSDDEEHFNDLKEILSIQLFCFWYDSRLNGKHYGKGFPSR
jgi:ribonucleoside-diphosphate reductase alpha chain